MGWNPGAADLAETLDGGQSFRWQQSGGVWSGVWGDTAAQLRIEHGIVQWRDHPRGHGPSGESLARYLGLRVDWRAQVDALPWRSDAHLAQCIAAFPELRILRQPFGDTLLGFLCSATKQIVQIKQMCALLAERHGRPLGAAASDSNPAMVGPLYRLPTWPELALLPERALRDCLLGFRARFIAGTAKFLAEHPGWLETTEALPYPEAKSRLMELPGVGEKVADCVLLFGAGQLAAFPVDTWVLKSLARRYGLDDWKPAQVAHFGRTHFGPAAGLAQQFLFAWERKYGGR